MRSPPCLVISDLALHSNDLSSNPSVLNSFESLGMNGTVFQHFLYLGQDKTLPFLALVIRFISLLGPQQMRRHFALYFYKSQVPEALNFAK